LTDVNTYNDSYVPYLGATDDVNIGDHEIIARDGNITRDLHVEDDLFVADNSEFSGDVDGDGMLSFKVGTGIASGASTNGLSFEISLDKTKYTTTQATAIATGITAYVAYAAWSAKQGNLIPATAGATVVVLFGIYDTMKKAIANSDIA